MNKLLKLKSLYLLITAISIFTLLSAVYIEYILGVKPCILCLYQRVPYIIAIFFCFYGYYNLKNKLWIYLLVITFLLSAILSGYHVGIENNILRGPAECSGGLKNFNNVGDLKDQILSKPVINCDEVIWSFFGVSAASINSLILLLIFIFNAIYIFQNYASKKKKII